MRPLLLLAFALPTFTLKSQCLNQQWMQHIGAEYGSRDEAHSITHDNVGNTIVFGRFNELLGFDPNSPFNLTAGESSGYTLFLAKYDPSGNLIWVNSMGGANANPEATGLAVDPSGNIFIAGKNAGDSIDFDPSANVFDVGGGMFVAKYSPAGSFIWAKQNSGNAMVSDLKIAANGDLLIAGGFQQNADFGLQGSAQVYTALGVIDGFLVRYSNNGVFQWLIRTGSPGFMSFWGTIVFDRHQNVICVGSYGGNVDFDPSASTFILPQSDNIFLARYSPAGALQWAKAFGGNQSPNYASGLGADHNDNLYIVGTAGGAADLDPSGAVQTLGSQGTFIAKYDSTGQFNWLRNIGQGSTYNRIVTDSAGRTYVSGVYYNGNDFDPGPAVFNLPQASGSDGFISRYDANGNFDWALPMLGSANEITFELSRFKNRVAVCGYFDQQVDFDPGPGQVIKKAPVYESFFFSTYDTSGTFLHVVAGHDADGGDDIGACVKTDASGNVYVTGSYRGTVDFDPSPATTTLTSKLTYGNGVTFSNPNIFLAKYDSGGNYQWAHGFGNMGRRNLGTAINLDSQGNVYLYGYFDDSLDIDPSSNVVNLVAKGGTDVFISKFSSTGNFIWARSFGGKYDDQTILSLVIDHNDDLVMTGFFMDTVDFDAGPGQSIHISNTMFYSCFITKYNTNGNFVWSRMIESKSVSGAYGVINDANDNLYLTGLYRDTTDFDPSAGTATLTTPGMFAVNSFIAKYDKNGLFGWVRQLRSHSSNRGSAINMDNLGDLYVTGEFRDSCDFDPTNTQNVIYGSGFSNVYLTKYNISGTCLWTRTFGSFNEKVYDVKVKNSDVFITGSFDNTVDFDPGAGTAMHTSAGFNNIYLSQFDLSGNFVCVRVIGTDGDDAGHHISIANTNELLLTGDYKNSQFPYTSFFPPRKDVLVAKYGYNCSAPQPAKVLSVLTNICLGDSVKLTAAAGGDIWWYNNATGGSSLANGTTYTLAPTAAGIHTFYVEGRACGIPAPRTAIQVTVLPAPQLVVTATPSVICSGETVSVNASGATTYTWSDGLQQPGFVTVPNASTNFTVEGSDTNNCKSTALAGVIVDDCVSLQLFSKGQNFLSPNPSSSDFTITLGAYTSHVQCAIYTISGQLVYKEVLTELKNAIELKGVTSGLYLVVLESEGAVVREKLVIQN